MLMGIITLLGFICISSILWISTNDENLAFFGWKDSQSTQEPLDTPVSMEPVSLPQNLTFGNHPGDSASPFLSTDVWVELVDNRRTFFVRPGEPDWPGFDGLKQWVSKLDHKVAILSNNNHDWSWPPEMNADDWKELLREPNLHAVYVLEARKVGPELQAKVRPLPLGLKWQYGSTLLYGESKANLKAIYSKISSSPSETTALFKSSNRTNTVWVRPMANTNSNSHNYDKDTPALSTPRTEIAGILKRTAPNTIIVAEHGVGQEEYLQTLTKHRFLANPPGNGLDTHSTWEALYAGCIPIIPHSPLDSMFDELPVWLINSWEEVTDEAVEKMSKEMLSKSYDFSMAFAEGWGRRIQEGLGK